MTDRQPRRRIHLCLRGSRATDQTLQARTVLAHHAAPAHPQHPRRLVDEHLQASGAGAGGRDMVDQFEFAMRFQQAGMRTDGVHPDTLEAFGRGDHDVRRRPCRQVDDEVVDGIPGAAFDDVEGQDVGAHRAQCHGQ